MLVHNNDYLLFCFVFFLNFLFINTKWIPNVFFTSFHRHSLYSNFRKDSTIGAKNKAFRLKVKHGKKPKRKEKKKANRRHVRHHLSVENMLECENKVVFFLTRANIIQLFWSNLETRTAKMKEYQWELLHKNLSMSPKSYCSSKSSRHLLQELIEAI